MSTIKTTESNPGWIKKLIKNYGSPKYGVQVGLPKGKSESGVAYPDGTSVLEVAFYNEFGTDTIPARPAIKKGGRKASHLLKDDYIKMIREVNSDAELVKELALLGSAAVAIVQAEILSLKAPPNAPSTVAAKKSANPLVDTKRYSKSITYQVKKLN